MQETKQQVAEKKSPSTLPELTLTEYSSLMTLELPEWDSNLIEWDSSLLQDLLEPLEWNSSLLQEWEPLGMEPLEEWIDESVKNIKV